MFRGEFSHSIDEKSRLIIPARFREALGVQCVATKGLDNCLWVYPMKEWEMFEDKLRGLQVTKPEARALVRFFSSGATECSFDRQGRILIPANLREYAGIERDVVITGVITRLEIWSQRRWAEYSTNLSDQVIAETIGDLGI